MLWGYICNSSQYRGSLGAKSASNEHDTRLDRSRKLTVYMLSLKRVHGKLFGIPSICQHIVLRSHCAPIGHYRRSSPDSTPQPLTHSTSPPACPPIDQGPLNAGIWNREHRGNRIRSMNAERRFLFYITSKYSTKRKIASLFFFAHRDPLDLSPNSRFFPTASIQRRNTNRICRHRIQAHLDPAKPTKSTRNLARELPQQSQANPAITTTTYNTSTHPSHRIASQQPRSIQSQLKTNF